MIYLDNAATSHPKPEEVYECMDRFSRAIGANPGRSGHRMAQEAAGEIAAVRRALTEFFSGRDPCRLIFTLNATDALNMAFKGLLDPGDHVITTVLEHNSVTRPLARMEADGKITVTRIIPTSTCQVRVEAIEHALQERTRLVVIGQASNVVGSVVPLADIGALTRRQGVTFAVDAAQGAGLLAIDIERDNIDLLAFTGHKALLGPVGTGGLYVSERVTLRAWREGGTGGDSTLPVQPESFPESLEAGTPNTAGIAGLGEALRFVIQQGPGNLLAHERALAARLWRALEEDPCFILYGPAPYVEEMRTGVVSLNVRGLSCDEVGGILDSSFDIAVRTGLHCAPGAHRFLGTFPAGTVRISPGVFNTIDQMDLLADALKEIARKCL